ncbi:hypothetical protein [Paenibacillus elgii]|uniref:hypothetical protein n=1 Tax=Paenibacillus elgii TaxID=189691 RepID=UPI00203EFA56|nr:hypothetical protein [Paenibacillus elgii]MCM3274325.1 hypothetical protein [Paenibacillus elgii]
MARSEQVMIRLSPEMKEKFTEISKQRGMSVSAMAAFLIGTFVQDEESRHRDSGRNRVEDPKG